jgi:hypothetical protein
LMNSHRGSNEADAASVGGERARGQSEEFTSLCVAWEPRGRVCRVLTSNFEPEYVEESFRGDLEGRAARRSGVGLRAVGGEGFARQRLSQDVPGAPQRVRAAEHE